MIVASASHVRVRSAAPASWLAAGGWLAARRAPGVVGGSQNRSRPAAAVQTRLAADDRLHAWSEEEL
jgi:hypothetical protein